jgi:hypothetical protein
MAMSSKLFLLFAGCAALGACNTVHRNIGQEDPGLGETVKYNAAIQTINPEPTYPAGSAQPGDSGVKGAAAVKRYRTDSVKQIEVMQTTSGTGGSPR